MAANRNTIQDAVYEELRNSILNMTLKPGTAMSTQDMATRLNVSRTPVREAFIRLQREGLVQAKPQRETVVSKIDLDRVEQERFLRENLELGAIEPFLQCCSKQDLNWIGEQIEIQKQLRDAKDYWNFVKNDDEMHRKLYRVSGQNLAGHILKQINGHYFRMRILTVQNSEILDNSIEQHERMLQYLRDDDLEGARKALMYHVRKINYEKIELIKQYGDLFVDHEETNEQPFKIESLSH